MKEVFLFFDLNLNTIVQEKTLETCMFHGWCFKTRSIKIFKCWNSVLLSLLKFLATRLVATASIYQTILWFVFYLIYVWSFGF